ncbi:MAG: hypothetical protein ACRDVP_12610 [Acidimicrobiales bacterium]
MGVGDLISGDGLGAIVSLLVVLGVLAFLLVLGVVGVVVILVVANRAEPDPSGRRPFSVYLFAVSFITLWTAVLGAIGFVGSLVQLIGTTRLAGPGIHPVGDAVARGAVLSGIVVVVSLAILVVHLGKGLEYARADGAARGPSGRVGQTYVAAVAFVSVLVFVLSVIVALYAVFKIIAPGVFGAAAGRTGAGRMIIDALWSAAVAIAVAASHRGLLPPGIQVLDLFRGKPPSALPQPE